MPLNSSTATRKACGTARYSAEAARPRPVSEEKERLLFAPSQERRQELGSRALATGSGRWDLLTAVREEWDSSSSPRAGLGTGVASG